MANNPVEGWYPSPENDGYLRWWDGSAWTEHEMPAPAHEQESTSPPPPSGQPLLNPTKKVSKTKQAANIAAGAGVGALGAALVADGAIGLGKKRKGFKGIGALLIIGSLIWLLSLFALFASIGDIASGRVPIETTGTVTSIQVDESGYCIPTVAFTVEGKKVEFRPDDFAKCVWEVGSPVTVSYDSGTVGEDPTLGKATGGWSGIGSSFIMGAVGLFIVLIGVIRLAVRAGSVAGGLLLLRQGFKMGTKDVS